VLSHRNVKIRVFTHRIGPFVLLHRAVRIVHLHMNIRAFTRKFSCFYTTGHQKGRAAAEPYGEIESRNTDSNFI
jgi:hypothetical protein